MWRRQIEAYDSDRYDSSSEEDDTSVLGTYQADIQRQYESRPVETKWELVWLIFTEKNNEVGGGKSFAADFQQFLDHFKTAQPLEGFSCFGGDFVSLGKLPGDFLRRCINLKILSQIVSSHVDLMRKN
eukprot:snap_masked-scaffold_23-processed-gene-5.5-mRNA-1 protein AED:1.00 eAED:1.00 QI:0/0/0/0/1/1/4/0/127